MRNILLVIVSLLILGCSYSPQKHQTHSWDFDHHVQFKQLRLKDGRYHLLIIANNKTAFSQLSSFTFRQAYKLCGQYGFKIEVLDGVEQVDSRRVSPSYIEPSLSVNISC